MSLKKMSREESELASTLNILAALTEPNPGLDGTPKYDSNREKLEQELWERLEGYRDSAPDICRYVIQRLMVAASAHDDEAELSALLDRAEELRREKKIEIGLLGRPLSAAKEPAEGTGVTEAGEDFYARNAFWINRHNSGLKGAARTVQPAHFDMLAARLDVRRDCSAGMLRYEQDPPQDEDGELGGCHFCNNWSMSNLFYTNLPEHYAAIISGVYVLVRWYWDQGAYGTGFLEKKEGGPIPLIRFPRLEEMREPMVRGCSSVITAALYSGSEEMLRFFLERFREQVAYRREMLFPLSRASRGMQELFLASYPEIWDQLTLRQILRYPSSLLLRGYIDRHGPLPAGTRLRDEAWDHLVLRKWSTAQEQMCRRMPGWCADFMDFFYVLLENTRDKDDWWKVLRAYAEWFFKIQIEPSFYTVGHSRFNVPSCRCLVQLPNTLYGLLCDLTRRGLLPEGTDLTPLILSDIGNKRGLWRTGALFPRGDLPDDPIRYRLDIYALSPRKAYPVTHNNFLTIFHPVRILPERDNVMK